MNSKFKRYQVYNTQRHSQLNGILFNEKVKTIENHLKKIQITKDRGTLITGL